MSAWLDPSQPPDVRLLTDAELFRQYHADRNGELGRMCAEEGMRRLEERERTRER